MEKIGEEEGKIKAGAENLESSEAGRFVETYEVHSRFSFATNDLAVVTTTKNMHFNNETQAICLPPTEELGQYDETGVFAMFQQEERTANFEDMTKCSSLQGLNVTCCSKMCVKLDHGFEFFPKDSGAPLIQQGGRRLNFEVIGILADLKEDDGTNTGVFAYLKDPDNFEFIKKKSKKG